MQYGVERERESKPLGKYHVMLPSGARWDRGQCAKLFLSLRAVVVLPTRSRNLTRRVLEWSECLSDARVPLAPLLMLQVQQKPNMKPPNTKCCRCQPTKGRCSEKSKREMKGGKG